MKNHNRDERRKHLEAWKAQGISGSEYCRLNGIKQSTFYSWIKNEKTLARRSADQQDGFVAIDQSVAARPVDTSFEIVIRKGPVSIHIAASASQAQLRNILAAIGAAG